MEHNQGPAAGAMTVQVDRRTALVRKGHIGESLSQLWPDEFEIDSRYRKLGEIGHSPTVPLADPTLLFKVRICRSEIIG